MGLNKCYSRLVVMRDSSFQQSSNNNSFVKVHAKDMDLNSGLGFRHLENYAEEKPTKSQPQGSDWNHNLRKRYILDCDFSSESWVRLFSKAFYAQSVLNATLIGIMHFCWLDLKSKDFDLAENYNQNIQKTHD